MKKFNWMKALRISLGVLFVLIGVLVTLSFLGSFKIHDPLEIDLVPTLVYLFTASTSIIIGCIFITFNPLEP
jgi:hypothetical protein